MNFNSPPGASGRENFSNVQPNAGQTAFAPNQFIPDSPNAMQQFRIRMDQPHSNERNERPSQQQMHQQRNTQPNYQPSPRFPGGEIPVRFPTNPASDNIATLNGPDRNFLEHRKIPGSFPQGPRMQMGPQPRFQGPPLHMRPTVSDLNPVASNQPKVPNFQQMDTARSQNHHAPQNQTLPQSENYQKQIIRDQPPILSRKSSTLDMNAPNNFAKLIRNESKSQSEIKPDSDAKSMPLHTPKEPRQQDAENSKSEPSRPANDAEDKNDNGSHPEVNQSFTKSEKKSKEIKQRERNIISGIVLKNIKFFEKNDTAKTPLVPQEIIVKKRERKVDSSPELDVVRCESNKDKYESGVDESPMVYPNLGSIFEKPRKVAKIPYRGIVKSKNKLKLDKKSRPPFQVLFKSRQGLQKSRVKRCNSHSFSKSEKPKASKIKNFGADEELLAFFHSTNSWRKLKSYGSSRVDRNSTKLENKPKANGDIGSPKKTPSKLPAPSKKNQPVSPAMTPLKSPGTPGAISLPKTPDSPAPSTPLIKKVPMNKIQVGAAPSPNLKTVKSKIGSLANTTHKPGGGNVKIESRKIDLSNAQARIEAKNDQYKRSGGDKKIPQVKLQWSAKPKIGSLENATYKPGGGDKKIESVKLDFKEKAKPKVGSKDNVKHVPGGGNVKIENQKLEFKAQSKVGSLDNVKHKPGGGDVKIFDDKTYLRQISGTSSEGRVSGNQSPLHTSVSKTFSETSQDGS